MTRPQPEPLLLRLDRFAELSVSIFDDGETEQVALSFARPDCDGAPLLETHLTNEQAVALIDRLVGTLAEIRRPEQPPAGGAGPLSSTF
jgi:hypothetical protein